jgi:flagellin
MMNVNRLDTLEKGLMRSMQRVASGERVTRAADDVAAHGVSERLRGHIRGLHAASRNAQDGIALINVAEAALNEVDEILHRMRELSVEAANGTNTDEDRLFIQMEVDKLKDEINATSKNTNYNNLQLLDGTGDWGEGKGGYFQTGTGGIPASPVTVRVEGANGYYKMEKKNSEPNSEYIRHRIPAVNTKTLGIDGDAMLVDTQESAGAAIDKVIAAVDYVNNVRANLGGIANRLEHAWYNIDKIAEDNESYESVLRDTDVPAEMISVTRDQIINQYCTAMLAQANQSPATILQLLNK